MNGHLFFLTARKINGCENLMKKLFKKKRYCSFNVAIFRNVLRFSVRFPGMAFENITKFFGYSLLYVKIATCVELNNKFSCCRRLHHIPFMTSRCLSHENHTPFGTILIRLSYPFGRSFRLFESL